MELSIIGPASLCEGLNAFMRVAIPRMDQKYAFFTDLIRDAETISNMVRGDRLYVALRDMGTTVMKDRIRAVKHFANNPEQWAIIVECDDFHGDKRWTVKHGSAVWFVGMYSRIE